MAYDEIFIGSEFILEFDIVDQDGTVIDISGATTMDIILADPSGNIETFAASHITTGDDGKLGYIIESDKLDEAGLWRAQAKVTITNYDYYSPVKTFFVKSRLGATAGEEPLTLDEVKNYLKVDGDMTTDDELIMMLIKTARAEAETITGRKLVEGTVTYYLSDFETNDGSYIRIPYPPVQSITSITYVDSGSVTQTWDSSKYVLTNTIEPCRIGLAYNETWPSVRGEQNDVTFTYVAGYESPPLIPSPIKIAIMMMVSDMYEHRESITDVRLYVTDTVQRLLAPYCVNGFWDFNV